MKRIGILGFLVVALAATSACVPRRSKQTTNVSTVSTGQQLTDLKAALDAGAISQEEFDKKQKEILKNN